MEAQGYYYRQYNDMKGDWDKTTWMARGEYDLTDSVMMGYLSYETGWKSGVLQDGKGYDGPRRPPRRLARFFAQQLAAAEARRGQQHGARHEREVDRLFRDVAEDCEQVVVTAEDISMRTSELDFGVLSDDTLALKFELELPTGAIEERDLIIMREGDLVSLVRLTGPRPSNKELLDTVVRVAIGRLGRLAEDTNGRA